MSRVYECTDGRHAYRDDLFRVESSATLMVDVGDDEPMRCCDVATIQRRREAPIEDFIELEDFIDSLPDADREETT